ncbi:MAG: phosphatidylserine decarboxylase family protein [Planctomycetes bacterium]|nr:phosphatidylserine decarboxylase family protein [Planctomycetota bacterium]
MSGFARDGIKELAAGLFFFATAGVLAGFFFPYALPVPALGFIFVAYFFRDPQRQVPPGSNAVVSPADGTIVDISEIDENDFLKCKTVRIGIFMSVFSVHVNRMPIAGRIEFVRHTPGKFLNALKSEASLHNENNLIGAHNDEKNFNFMVRQIAGIIARRIVCGCKTGDILGKGEKFGMIKFGSRAEVYLPKEIAGEFKVKLNDKVKAGESILVMLK